jgi:hypothetical protein
MILPKTDRGKPMRLTAVRLEHLPAGCECCIVIAPNNLGTKSGISVENQRNNKRLPITGDSNIASVKELYEWLDDYMRTCPSDYFEKVEKMKNSPHITVKYQAGDIFRIELDRTHYGFGIIIGEVIKLKKEGIFSKEHPISFVPDVPIMTRLYLIKTTEKNMSVEDITKHGLLPTDFIVDADVFWGVNDIIGSKDLEENDIEFPIQVVEGLGVIRDRLVDSDDMSILQRISILLSGHNLARLFWGPAYVELSDRKKIALLKIQLRGHNFEFTRVAGCGVPIDLLEGALEGKSMLSYHEDLRHEDNRSTKEKIFGLFGLPPDISYDEFNRKNNGMTRKEFAEYVNKTRKHIRKR